MTESIDLSLVQHDLRCYRTTTARIRCLMSAQTLHSISSRLTTTQTLLLERQRILSLSLPPSASSTAQVVRNLTSIKADLEKIQSQVDTEEAVLSAAGRRGGKGKLREEGELGKSVRELGERFDRLVGMLGDDEIGRDKARELRRVVKRPSSEAEDTRPVVDTINTAPAPPIEPAPALNIEPPTPAVNPNDPFRDYPDSKSDDYQRDTRDPHELLSEQQMMMDDQDERLNLLSNSIGRQNHLSVQIGTELDIHHDLLEDTDAAMDRTTARLGHARKRLDKVASEARQYGSTITIVVLIFILLILIIVFKT